MAGRFRVAELEPVPQRPGLVVGEREQLGHRVALDVRGAQEVLDGELPAREIALEGEVGDAHRPMMAHHAGHDSTHRHRRRADGARRPPVGDGAHAGRAARARAGRRRCARDRGSGRRRGPRRRRPGDRPRVRARRRTRGRRTGQRICEFLPRERDLVAAAVGGDAAGPTTRDCSSSAATARRMPARWPGCGRARPRATPGDRLVRRPRRLQHARHDAVGERLGDALRDAVRARRPGPRRAPPTARRVDGAGRRAVRRAGARRGRVADARGVADRPFRGRDARDAGRARRAVAGWAARGRRARSTGSTSRSTWIASTRAGGWALTMPEPGGLALATALAVGPDARGGDAGRRVRRDRGDPRQRRRAEDGRCDRAARRGGVRDG